jgi:hypothetical protein
VGVRYWLGLRHAEEQRAQEEVVTRAREDAAGKIKSSEAQIETLRRAIAGIVTDDARKSALAGCDDVSRSLDDAARLDASNVDLAQVRKDLSDVRERIGRVVIAPPPTPTGRNDVLQAAVDAIEEDLRFAGDASTKPLSALERAIQRADRGITGARDVLKSHPEEGRARTLLVELEAARPRLLERRKGLLDKRKKDLDAAAELLGKASTSAECDKVRTLLANVLRDDPEQADALRLQGRLTDVARKLEDRPGKTSGDMKSSEKPPPLPPSQPTLPQPMLRDEVESLAAKARQQPLSTEEGLLARIAANRDALRRIAAAGGAAWTSDASRAAEADLDRTLIAKLFYDFSRAVRARDLPAVFAAFPAYKGRGTLEDARAVEFELRDLAVESDLGGATATQSLRILPSAGSWKGPFIDKFRFTLRRQSDHFVIVEQKLL